MEEHGTPDTDGNQPLTPIPTIVIRRLASINTQARMSVVIVGRIIYPAFLICRQSCLKRRSESDQQFVFLLQQALHRHTVPHEHIFRTQNLPAVQLHLGISIQTLKFENAVTAFQLFIREFEYQPVSPVMLACPLYGILIGSPPRIG